MTSVYCRLLLLIMLVPKLCLGTQATPAVTFTQLAVMLDSGEQSLASYQIEITVSGAKIVGVEGGEHPAFQKAPFFDPAALQGGLIKLAAFSTSAELPHGRTRIATLHLMSSGEVRLEPRAQLTLATDADAHSIEVEVQLVSPGNGGR